MVDLVSQLEKIKPSIDTVINEVLSTAQFINGPEVKAFQIELQDYLGVKHVIPCANGTDALQVALMALDLNPGDEVITTDFTFASSVEVIALLGLKPVLVDVEIDTFNIDFNKIEKAITNKTKAIIPVHLLGNAGNIAEIKMFCEDRDIVLIEDSTACNTCNLRILASQQK